MGYFQRMRQRHIESMWKQHKADFLRLHSLEQSKIKTIKDLEFSFIDLQGKSYYQFPGGSPLPTERYGKLTEYLMWMDGGFHKAELLNIKEAQGKALIEAAKKPEALAKAIAINEELGSRSGMIVHTELLYEIVAVCCVREDENPEKFNERIQAEKVKAFKEFVAERGSYFFFQKFPLKELKHLKEMSELEWTSYWHESLIKQQATKEKLKAMQQKSSSPSSKQESRAQGEPLN